MIIRHPEKTDIDALKNLWCQAFNDSDSFLNDFFEIAFEKNHSMIIEKDKKLASMLFWLDCTFDNKKVAYVYAIATFKNFQKQGLCKNLMTALHAHLKASGYVGACLVPSSDNLFIFYGKMGYIKCIYNNEDTVLAKEGFVDITKISAEEYIRLRKTYLPKKSITQNNIRFLKSQSEFFKGNDFIFAIQDGSVYAYEFWGNKNKQPYILHSQNIKKGIFRTNGDKKPFAMYLPLKKTELPEYLDFAFD